MASVKTLDAAFRSELPDNGRILRNLILAADFIQSHILHFYHLTLPDFVNGPNMPPWQPSWSTDRRFDAAETTALVNNYIAALDMRRKAHEMGAIFGGKMPIAATYVPGGITAVPTSAQISQFRTYLTGIINFINNTYIPDVEKIASRYNDYYAIGEGTKNLMAFGVFDLDSSGSMLLRRGMAMGGSSSIESVDVGSITENVKYSWYADSSGEQQSPQRGYLPAIPQGRRVFLAESAAISGTACRSRTVGKNVGKRRLPARYFYDGQAQG